MIGFLIWVLSWVCLFWIKKRHALDGAAGA